MKAVGTALALAARGHPVLPLWWPAPRNGRRICACPRGAECQAKSMAKHPIAQLNPPHGPKIVPNGLLSASIDSEILKHWWSLAPDANLGVRTDRLIALDIDERNDGVESLAALEREHGALPTTWRSRTGGGGEHLIFACPDNVSVASSNAHTDPKLGPGIDVRSTGGYIVTPPSVHISGRPYAWDVDHHPGEIPLALPPEWLLTRLAEPKGETAHVPSSDRERTPPEEWLRLVSPEVCISEYRDMAAARVAGHLLRRFVEPALVWGLLHAWNTTYCRPPLSAFELRRILDRILQREAARRARTDTAVNESDLASIAALLGVAR